MIDHNNRHIKRQGQGEWLSFTGDEDYEAFRQKIAEHFNVPPGPAKVGRLRDNFPPAFDGQTFKEYLKKRALYNSKCNVYLKLTEVEHTQNEETDMAAGDGLINNDNEQSSTQHPHFSIQEPSEAMPEQDSTVRKVTEEDLLPRIEIQNIVYGAFIGQGGGGTVHKAIWNRKEVAVKDCLVGRQAASSSQMIHEEASTMARLRHPNILQILGICIQPEKVTLVLELMHSSLYSRVLAEDRRPLLDVKKLYVLKETVQGISFLHSKKVVHGDVKLENVLLSANIKIVKLCDFGLARYKETAQATMVQGDVAGTPMYKAPEMLLHGEHSVRNFATDMWALGGVIVETFMEESLWCGSQPKSLMGREMRKKALPSACKALQKARPIVFDAVRACFEYNPDARASPQELLDSLDLLQL